MSNKSSPAVIGGFVLGAIALLVAAVLIFGGGELFASKRYLVTYFPGSVKGLRVGSDVMFRGVRIGYVTDIEVTTDPDVDRFSIPVTFQVLPDAIIIQDADGNIKRPYASADGTLIRTLIERGLRTKLETESYVTGQLLIQLDFYPSTEPVFRGVNTPYPEVPSVPSDVQQVLQRLERLAVEFDKKIDSGKLLADLQGIMDGLNKLANSPDLADGLAGISKLANARETQALPADVSSAARSLAATMNDTRQLIGRLDKDVDPLMSDIQKALTTLNAGLTSAAQLLEDADQQLGQQGATRYEINNTLVEVQQAARSLRTLTDYLALHPEALIRGKPEPKEKP
jgi:paraquat-inducible protein B